MEEERSALTLDMRGIGTFVMRRSNIMDQLKIGKRRRAILQDNDADLSDRNTAHIMATVDVLAETKPNGFSWEQVYDLEALMDFWSEFNQWEVSLLDTKSAGTAEDGGSGGK